METELKFRQALPEDSDFAFRVKKDALGQYIEETWGWDDDFQKDFHLRSYDPSGISILCISNEDIGYIETETCEKYVAITGLYILEDFQRRGYGTCALKKIIKRASDNGLSVKLAVLKVNQNALRLYERLGFEVEGECIF